jgi:hypothetical protein
MKQVTAYHKNFIRQNATLREQYLQPLIEDLNDRDPRERQTVKTILHTEQTKRDFNIRIVFKGNNGKGITHIQVADDKDPTKWKNILDRNKKHFGQAHHTIFATGDLKQHFENEGTNKNAEYLISGKVIHSTTINNNEAVQNIINKLGDKSKTPDITNNITYDKFCAGVLKWDDRTTTSPSV